MATRQLRSIVEIEDFARGATYFGTGGGGSYESGVKVLSKLFHAGYEIGWVDAAEIPKGVMSASPFGMGSIVSKRGGIGEAAGVLWLCCREISQRGEFRQSTGGP